MIINTIDTKDISVVVQGGIDSSTTSICLSRIRKYLPESEIILSTWEGSNLDGLEYDKLILNHDPGAGICDPIDGRKNNTNRQIQSTYNGIKQVNRRYTLKIRSDVLLESNGFVRYFGKFNKDYVCKGSYPLFKNRILIPCVWTREKATNDGKVMWQPYHISDWMMFGLTEDVLTLFDIPFQSEYDACYYFLVNCRKQFDAFDNGACQHNWRYTPEQYILYNCIKKKYPEFPNFDHKLDYTSTHMELYHKILVENFIVINKEMWSFSSEKHDLDYYILNMFDDLIKYSDYLKLFSEYYYNKRLFFLSKIIRKYESINIKLNMARNENKQKSQENITFQTITSLSEIDNSCLSGIKVISLDLFNTLLFRESSPDWIATSHLGMYITMLLHPYNRQITIEKVNLLRDKLIAEQYRNNKNEGLDEEYNLRCIILNILCEFGVPDVLHEELLNVILKNEVQRELDTLYLNKEAISFLFQLYQKGYRIIITSDMYLPKECLVKILEYFGINIYISEIYVSSDYYKRKNGKLFEFILEKEKVAPREILHIGDDINNDIFPALSKGLVAIHYNNEAYKEIKYRREKVYIHQESFSSFLSDKFTLMNGDAFDKAVNYFGLDLNNFTFFMVKNVKLFKSNPK